LQLLVSQRKAVQAPSASESEFSEFFTAEKILRDFHLDPEEIESGVAGQESNDGQVGADGISDLRSECGCSFLDKVSID
jgi:hypothetical protein